MTLTDLMNPDEIMLRLKTAKLQYVCLCVAEGKVRTC